MTTRKMRKTVETTKEYINIELAKARDLLWSGSLHEVDEAHNIVARLIEDLQQKRKGQ